MQNNPTTRRRARTNAHLNMRNVYLSVCCFVMNSFKLMCINMEVLLSYSLHCFAHFCYVNKIQWWAFNLQSAGIFLCFAQLFICFGLSDAMTVCCLLFIRCTINLLIFCYSFLGWSLWLPNNKHIIEENWRIEFCGLWFIASYHFVSVSGFILPMALTE